MRRAITYPPPHPWLTLFTLRGRHRATSAEYRGQPCKSLSRQVRVWGAGAGARGVGAALGCGWPVGASWGVCSTPRARERGHRSCLLLWLLLPRVPAAFAPAAAAGRTHLFAVGAGTTVADVKELVQARKGELCLEARGQQYQSRRRRRQQATARSPAPPLTVVPRVSHAHAHAYAHAQAWPPARCTPCSTASPSPMASC
jgi:hypothetical protein